MEPERKFELVGIAFGLVGVGCIGFTAGWLAALGVFLMMWGDAMVSNSHLVGEKK